MHLLKTNPTHKNWLNGSSPSSPDNGSAGNIGFLWCCFFSFQTKLTLVPSSPAPLPLSLPGEARLPSQQSPLHPYQVSSPIDITFHIFLISGPSPGPSIPDLTGIYRAFCISSLHLLSSSLLNAISERSFPQTHLSFLNSPMTTLCPLDKKQMLCLAFKALEP